ncbi:cyclin-domain-containing protein, partial [Dichotomocladium elegans]
MDIAAFPISILIRMVADLLESVILANDIIPSSSRTITPFHSRAVPKIKIGTYLSRIQKYTPYSSEALLSILVFFDRISQLHPEFVLNSYNIHRMLIASIVVAAKFSSDIFYSNARYAKVGGVSLSELNRLEIEFLFLCHFDLNVRLETLQEYGNHL